MAHMKNSNRRKRKYGPERQAATEHNRTRRQERGEELHARAGMRTRALVGRTVIYGGKTKRWAETDDRWYGTVAEVVERGDDAYPTEVVSASGESRKPVGRYLVINMDGGGTVLRPRKSVKLV